MKFLLLMLLSFPSICSAKIQILTTTADLRALAVEVAGDRAMVLPSLALGTQDPHDVSSKPSFILQIEKADLLVSIGLGLEDNWLNPVARQGRNNKLKRLVLGPELEPLEVSRLDLREKSLHPDGNPHVTLDPTRMGLAAMKLAATLGALDPSNSHFYVGRAQEMKDRLDKKTKSWAERIKNAGVTKVVTYHNDLVYFLTRFQIQSVANLEPRPGVEPTAKHLLTVIKKMKSEETRIILVENFFDPKLAEKIRDESTGVQILKVPVSVLASPELQTLDDLYEKITTLIESVKK